MYQTSSSDKQWRGHRVCSGRGCNRGLGAEPPAGLQGEESPVEGKGEGACPPWGWMPFCFCVSKGSCKFAPLLIFAKVSKSHSEWMSHCLTTHLCHVAHIHLQFPLNSDKFNLCSCAIRRFSFTAHRPNAVVYRVRKSTPLDLWRYVAVTYLLSC